MFPIKTLERFDQVVIMLGVKLLRLRGNGTWWRIVRKPHTISEMHTGIRSKGWKAFRILVIGIFFIFAVINQHENSFAFLMNPMMGFMGGQSIGGPYTTGQNMGGMMSLGSPGMMMMGSPYMGSAGMCSLSPVQCMGSIGSSTLAGYGSVQGNSRGIVLNTPTVGPAAQEMLAISNLNYMNSIEAQSTQNSSQPSAGSAF